MKPFLMVLAILFMGVVSPVFADDAQQAELKMLRAQVSKQTDLAREVVTLRRENAELKKQVKQRDETIDKLKKAVNQINPKLASKNDSPATQPTTKEVGKGDLAYDEIKIPKNLTREEVAKWFAASDSRWKMAREFTGGALVFETWSITDGKVTVDVTITYGPNGKMQNYSPGQRDSGQ